MRHLALLILLFIHCIVHSSIVYAEANEPVRALHFVLGASPVNLKALDYASAKRMIKLASLAGINTVVVQIANSVQFDAFPRIIRPKAWSKEDLKNLVNLARVHHIELIPEIKLLTHQEKFLQDKYSNFLFNSKTYNPSSQNLYVGVFRYLEEVISIMQPSAIHIGHDEVAGRIWKRKFLPDVRVGKLEEEEKMLPADLFLKDVLTIHAYLKGKGIETWMWGDMLLSPDEFPSMRLRHLHGGDKGYGKALRDKLPKDIVICDWHYFDSQQDFPSLKVMQEEGFRVIGSTWKKEKTIKNFSGYATKHGAYGMMATTWWHVQKKEWDVVDRIIDVSGKTFLKDFPDAK